MTLEQVNARRQAHAAIDAAMDKVQADLASQSRPEGLSQQAFELALQRILSDVEDRRHATHRALDGLLEGGEAIFERDAGNATEH
jgi:hypothetical protein